MEGFEGKYQSGCAVLDGLFQESLAHMGKEAPKLEYSLGDLSELLLLSFERVFGKLRKISQLRRLAFHDGRRLLAISDQQIGCIEGHTFFLFISILTPHGEPRHEGVNDSRAISFETVVRF